MTMVAEDGGPADVLAGCQEAGASPSVAKHEQGYDDGDLPA